MTRMLFKIYAVVLGSLLLFSIAIMALWVLLSNDKHYQQSELLATSIIASGLPAANAPIRMQKIRLRQLSKNYLVDLGLYDSNGQLLVKAGRYVPPHFNKTLTKPLVTLFNPRPKPYLKNLDDGRTLFVHARRNGPNEQSRESRRFLFGLLLLFSSITIIAVPFVKRLTDRLERLNEHIKTWGESGYEQKIIIEGNDEVANLAKTFNQSSTKIAQLINAQKKTLAYVSHELRTPLARIQLQVSLLENLIKDGDQANYEQRRTSISKNIAELNNLIDQLLLSSRLDAGIAIDKVTKIDLYDLLKTEVQHYDDVYLQGESCIIDGDHNLLIMAFRNIINNAYQHGKPPVTIKLEKKDKIIIEFTDNGKGVSEQELPYIFDDFYIQKNFSDKKLNTGLGLAITRKIIELHNGKIDAIPNQNNLGLTFKISLPIITKVENKKMAN